MKTPTYETCWGYPRAYVDKLEERIAALETAVAALESAAKGSETLEKTTKGGK